MVSLLAVCVANLKLPLICLYEKNNYRKNSRRLRATLSLPLSPPLSLSFLSLSPRYSFLCYSLLSATFPAPGKNNNLHRESLLLPPLLLLRLLLRFYYFSLLLCSLWCSCCCCCCATFYLRAALLPAFMLLYFNLVYLATPPPRISPLKPLSPALYLADWRCNFSRRFSHKHAMR